MDAQRKTLVINTVGEPGSGKTTLSFWLSQALKKAGVSTEFIPEIVKYECYEAAGQARVRSGKFDRRYLRQQARLLLPVLGNVEVAINDGAFELSYFYASRRMSQEELGRFRSDIDAMRERAGAAGDHWFVMPKRDHAYETIGRNETEAEALEVRRQMIACLEGDFRIPLIQVHGEEDRVLLLETILKRVLQQRQS